MLPGYLTNTAGPVPLVLDIHIAHGRFGSGSDPSINGHLNKLHYPNDLDGSLNEAAADKIRQYLTDYNNRPSNTISFMSPMVPVHTCRVSLVLTLVPEIVSGTKRDCTALYVQLVVKSSSCVLPELLFIMNR